MDANTDRREELAKEAGRIAEDAEFTGRQHLATGQRWRQWDTWMGLPVVVISAATSAGAGLSALSGGATWVTAVLAFVGAIAAAVRLFFRPDEQADAHSSKGTHYINLRDDARRCARLDAAGPMPTDELAERIDQLGRRLNILRAQEPREVPPDIYKKVRAEIEGGNYRHQADT